MLSKKDLIRCLQYFGFEQKAISRTAGSHITYTHKIYTNYVVGIVDHKNTKDISPMVYNDAVNAITMIVVLECRNGSHIDYVKVRELLNDVNSELAHAVMTKVKRVDFYDKDCMSRLLSKSMLARMNQIYKDSDNNTVLRFLKNG